MPTGSAVDAETTIERIQAREGVAAFVICGAEKADETGEKHYEIHRKGQSMSNDQAQRYADRFSKLTSLARSVTRDLDPQNELLYFRIKAKKQEILIAPKYRTDNNDIKYHIITVQNTGPQ
mmetsp:Transcript_16716/g.29593  ORF Transcript_16716/g.29593 Transcript_16716/m.29593 type:complete len:121 (+) Transcript_16716:167-529(+)